MLELWQIALCRGRLVLCMIRQLVLCEVMLKVVRHILLLLIAFALVGGTTIELARSAQYVAPITMVGMPCNMSMAAPASGDAAPMPPCKQITRDCLKLMGCATVTALPNRSTGHEMMVRYSNAVDYYWTASSTLAGLDHKPEPLPPRAT